MTAFVTAESPCFPARLSACGGRGVFSITRRNPHGARGDERRRENDAFKTYFGVALSCIGNALGLRGASR